MNESPRDQRDPWFCLPVLVCMAADAGISLLCQPASYWIDPSRVDEGNPTWRWLLARGPAMFILGFSTYGAVLAGVLALLKGVPQKLLGMFVMLSHSYGAASWCHVSLSEDAYWPALVALMLVEASAFALYWSISPVCSKQRDRPPANGAIPESRDRGHAG